MSFSNKNQKNPGYDKKVNVKVRKFNETTGVIEEVNGSDATVLINFKSLKFDYDIFALYDKDLMIYSVPLSSSGLIYTDELARYNILRLIKNTLELACTKTKSGDVNLDKAILGLIATYVCPVPTPVSAAVCAAAGAGIIICTANEVLSILEKAFEQSKNPYINQFKDLLPTNDPSFVPLEDASVTVTSKHYKFGYKSTTPILASKIPENPNLIDFEITYTYRVPSVTTSTVTNIEQTSAKVSGNVVDEGGSFVYDRGVCLGTKPSPSIKQKVSSGSGSGVFTIDLTGLVAGAKYYVRSYASNKIETSYGNEVSFIAKVPEGWCRVEVLWKQPFGSPSFNSSCTNCQVIKFIGDIFGTISWCYEREPVGGQIGQAYLMKSGSSMTFYQTDYICPGPTVTLGPYKCQ